MSLVFRRFLYIFAIIIFLVIAPLLIMYTAGFRFDVYKKTFRPTGSFYIKSIPEKTDVYINDSKVSTKTPVMLNHLLPNTYTVSVKKPEFDTWSKELIINPRTTTFAENIVLWYTNPHAKPIIKEAVDFACISPRENFVLFTDNTSLQLFTISTDTSTKLKELNAEITNCTWSKNEAYALLTTKTNQTLLYTSAKQSIEIITHAAGTISQARFHPTLTDTITYTTAKGLYQSNILTEETQTLLAFPITDYVIQDDAIYYIFGSEPTLISHITLGSDQQKPTIQLPQLKQPMLGAIIDNRVFIHDTETQTLYSISLEPEKINKQSHIFHSVKNWKLNAQKNKIIISNDWEVSVVHLPEYTIETITRVSTPIYDVIWYADTNYILAQYSNHIESIELDRRDTRNTSELIYADTIKAMALGYDGEFLYALATTGSTTSFTQYQITEVDKSIFAF